MPAVLPAAMEGQPGGQEVPVAGRPGACGEGLFSRVEAPLRSGSRAASPLTLREPGAGARLGEGAGGVVGVVSQLGAELAGHRPHQDYCQSWCGFRGRSLRCAPSNPRRHPLRSRRLSRTGSGRPTGRSSPRQARCLNGRSRRSRAPQRVQPRRRCARPSRYRWARIRVGRRQALGSVLSPQVGIRAVHQSEAQVSIPDNQ